MEKITAFLRVESGAIKPFTFRANCNPPQLGEAMEFKSSGYWIEDYEHYPVSLHLTEPIGLGVVPVTGDYIKVTVESATPEEMGDARNQELVRKVAGY